MPVYNRRLGIRKLFFSGLLGILSLPFLICTISLFRKAIIFIEYGEYSKLATLVIILIPLSIISKHTVKLYYEGKGLMMKEADEIFTVHSEFILYLRSFKFDMAQGIEKSWESIFVNLFKKSAPVIAIGMPEDKITPVGANRIYIKPDNSWQDKITDLIPKAKLTIVIIDNSEGLLWEIEQIARIGDPEKTVFFLPPSQERGLFYEDFKYKTNGFFNNNLPQFPLISNRYFISFNNEWEIMPLKNKSFLYYLNRFYEYFLNEKDDTIKCIAESGSIVKKIHGKTNWLFILTRIPNVFIMALQAFAIIIFFVAMLLIFVFKI